MLKEGYRKGHWGLPGMRERANKMRGDLRVSSRNGGTQIDLRCRQRSLSRRESERILALEPISKEGTAEGRLCCGLGEETEPLADFIARAASSRDVFVKNEFVRGEVAKVWLSMDLTLEFPKPACAFAFTAGQCDVGMVGTSLGNEPTEAGRSGDALLQRLQFGS